MTVTGGLITLLLLVLAVVYIPTNTRHLQVYLYRGGGDMAEVESVYITQKEATQILGCSPATASRCFKQLNEKLRQQGLWIMKGKTNRKAFYDFIGKDYRGGV